MDYGHRLDYVGGELQAIRDAGLYREMRYGRTDGARISMGGRDLLNLCSNDYLGMPPTPIPQGQLQSSSRLVSGSDEEHRMLEAALASHSGAEAALAYPTGYMANMGAISALAGRGDLVLSDELNHASIIDACRCSGASISVYKHNDMDDLRAKAGAPARRKFIISEGIFSMDGDYADLAGMSETAKGCGAITILDDAHGDFAVGAGGGGTPEALACGIDVYVSSLSKALGSFGGYVAADSGVIDLCANRSRQFIYTSALPRQLAGHAAGRIASDMAPYRERLARNVKKMSAGLGQLGYEAGDTHIMPIIIGGEREAVEFGRLLLEQGVFAQPNRYPTVPRGSARIRMSVTAWLSDGDVDAALGAVEHARSRT